jgi:hypothetical protein
MATRRPTRRLAKDESGATLVMGVFMAAFLVAMIYYVLGLGQAVLYKESMQDASDTASFAAAVIHARGMNMLALLNMLMAAVLAVLVALETTLLILYISLILAIIQCLGGSIIACIMIPVYMNGINFVSNHIAAVRDSILGVVRAAAAVEQVVAREIPVAAAAKVRQYGREVYNPPTRDGQMISMSLTGGLPVEVDDSGYPCMKAGRQADMLVPVAIRYWPPDPVWPGWQASIPGFDQMHAAPYCPSEGGGTGDEPMRAVRVKEGLQLGDDEFQVQAFISGETDMFELGETGVSMAVVWTPEARGWRDAWQSMEEMTKMSFAQSEYYFDDGDYGGDIDRREWMWHMNWRARMRKFRNIPGTPEIGTPPFEEYPTQVIH